VRDHKLAAFVVQLVALSTDVGAGVIASRSRQSADAARARQIAMYLVHTACEWRLARVASAFGRDRSTISYACRRVEDQREDASFDSWLVRLEGYIRAIVFGGVTA
jgi:chromosomal replication initiation ATPase DnaA